MLRISHIALLLITLTGSSATAQMTGSSDAELAARIKINGVLLSANNRIALINDRLARVGEQVGEAEIIAIESNAVHMRVADRAFAMRVGSSLIWESDHTQIPETGIAVADSADLAPVPHKAELEHDPPFEPDLPGMMPAGESYWPVAPGETLSEIAIALAPDPRYLAATMDALYEHNPAAFGDSMDLLYAGAHLDVPPSVVAAAAKPAANPDEAPLSALAATGDPPENQYVTVQRGDTLSEIAVSLASNDITLNQAMLAIFEANPDSFGGNLNLLYAGEILSIPDSADWRRRTPQAAHAEVSRHAAVWQSAAAPFNST